MRSGYFGADEFFEVQGEEGFVWVTRATGEMLDLPPVVLYQGKDNDRTLTEFDQIDADWGTGFRRSSAHFVEALRAGTPAAMSATEAAKVLQLCFAVYQASDTRQPVDPRTHHRIGHPGRLGRVVSRYIRSRRTMGSSRWTVRV